ncbi:MAG TPA: alpha/beta fold hydrolase [Ohtaekwangia sp.]
MSKKTGNFIKIVSWSLFAGVVALNIVAFVHAYTFTHFTADTVERTKDPSELSPLSKIKILFTGIDNPRPRPRSFPKKPFQTIEIVSTEKLEGWKIPTLHARGTVILFHGYAGEKSSLLSRADEFNRLGYNTVLIDFMGSGGSSGNATTIGFEEAEQVKDCFEAVHQSGETNIILFGTSMGAAAILKALDDYAFSPTGIILECPFGSLYKTVTARFKMMGIPDFPMAAVLTFWGGVQNGYWAFGHNPYTYAQSVQCPTLLLFGEQDDRVSKEETEMIFSNINGPKTLKVYPDAGHQIFTSENEHNWIRDVSAFVSRQSDKKQPL